MSTRTYGGRTAEQIKAAAQAATPGPWETVAGPFNTHVSSRSGFVVGGEGMASYGQDVINAHYIAAANPAVVLELIARLRAAEAALGLGEDDTQGEPSPKERAAMVKALEATRPRSDDAVPDV